MEPVTDLNGNTLFANEKECIAYLFRKRWPLGFHCPFCDRVQPDIAPAHTVVCRYCRKQSSIAANTLMHGSKKSLDEWMQVSILFCFAEDGISARTLQNTFHLSSYQTAWNWLRRLRKAASIAESTQLTGEVAAATLPQRKTKNQYRSPLVTCLYELPVPGLDGGRIRLTVFTPGQPESTARFTAGAVQPGATIHVTYPLTDCLRPLRTTHKLLMAGAIETSGLAELAGNLQQWLDHLYRGATSSKYTQDYLDEYTFRRNTASWPVRLAVLDHLFTGLLHDEAARAIRQTRTGRRAGR